MSKAVKYLLVCLLACSLDAHAENDKDFGANILLKYSRSELGISWRVATIRVGTQYINIDKKSLDGLIISSLEGCRLANHLLTTVTTQQSKELKFQSSISQSNLNVDAINIDKFPVETREEIRNMIEGVRNFTSLVKQFKKNDLDPIHVELHQRTRDRFMQRNVVVTGNQWMCNSIRIDPIEN